MRSHDFGSLTTDIVDDGGVAVIRVCGVVCPSRGAQMFAACDVDMSALRPAALVARYDGAAMALNPGQMLAAAAAATDHGAATRVPTALVVPPDMLEFWRVYCHLQGMRGVLRAAFVSPVRARNWAAEHAALWAAQATTRGRE